MSWPFSPLFSPLLLPGMSDEKESKITVYACGPSTAKCKCQCPDGPCEHKWDGPDEEFDGGRGVSVTCSRCGMSAFQHSLWTGP